MPETLIPAGSTVGALQIRPLLDPLDNRILLGHALGLSRVSLITQSERVLTPNETERLSSLLARRLQGEPIAYIVGQREFFGLPFEVNDAVLIPRPDTEVLVELALERLPPGGRVLDMGTGSGAIAVALAHTRPDVVVTALDVSSAALAVARRNASANGVNITFMASDWFEALGTEKFDLIVSNPPYIASGDRHLAEGDLRFEPSSALVAGEDGLDDIRLIIGQAPAYLDAAGWLLLEHGFDQAAAVRELLMARGFTAVESRHDLGGHERISLGQWA